MSRLSDAESRLNNAALSSIAVNHTRLDPSTPPGLHMAERFTAEQRATAETIWLPLLRRLLPALPGLTRLECAHSPNGLVLESSEGWVITLCSLEGQRLPHVIGVRRLDQGEEVSAVKAFLLEGGYGLQPNADADPVLMRVLRQCLNSLSAFHVDSDGVSRRVRSPRLQRANRSNRAA
ncbi:hypothetical protein [Synechococcus sp. LA31]|uniref:hypothetical protein n=1 Tax=Synechococcus sp. LA31 TaxID=2741953 RepID=UPI001BDBB382|nr:hypothetical protein [Synechococcus sp. LA31]QVV67956.1 hypothetical protein KJJ24_01815 [Synechococcus sp. LA31]